MAINVCLSTANGVVSRVIRWFTRSTVSHSFITFRDDTLDKVFVMEANGRGFMLVPWKKWLRGHTVVARYELDVPEEDQNKSLQELANYLGAQYDYISLLGFLLRRFFSRMKNPFNNSSKLVCSEVVAKFLHRTTDSRLAIFVDYETWTPEDVYSCAQKRPDIFIKRESSSD